MDTSTQNNTHVNIPIRIKVAGISIFTVSFILFGLFTYLLYKDGISMDSIPALFVILPLTLILSIQIVGFFFGVPVAIKFLWDTIHAWSILIILAVIFLGAAYGWIIMAVMLIKDYVEYRKLKKMVGHTKKKYSSKLRTVCIVLVFVTICILMTVGVCLGYAVDTGFYKALNFA